MKKILFFLLISFMVGCSQDDSSQDDPSINDVGEDIKTPQDTTTLYPAGDGKPVLLGCGYDITGAYLDITSTKAQVLDIKKLIEIEEAANLNPIDSVITTSQNTYFYYGYNGLEYIKDINRKVIGHYGGTKDSPLSALGENVMAFTGTLNVEKDSNSKNTFLSKDSYAKSESIIRFKQLKINRLPWELYSYLSEDFKNNLKSYTAKELINKYGTHVLTDITFGGRLVSEFSSTCIENDSYAKTLQVRAGLKVSLGAIGLNTDMNVTSTDNKKNITQNLHIRGIGGTKRIDVTYDMVNTKPPILNTKPWKDAVYANRDRYAALVEVNWNRAYFLYDFIEDPVKKEAVRQEIINYIQNAQLEEIETVPVYQWYNPKTLIYAYSASPTQEHGPDFICHGMVFWALKNKTNETSTVYQWYNTKTGAYAYGTNTTQIPSPDYILHGPVFNTPKSNDSNPNIVTIYQWYRPTGGIYAYGTNTTQEHGPDYICHGPVFSAYK